MTSHDAAGNTGTDVLTVTYYAATYNAPRMVNSDATNPNAHYNSGHNRMARINGVSFVLTPNADAGEAVWKSYDDGMTWEKFGTSSIVAFSGSLISGPNDTIYHFYRESNTIYMRKFRYDATVFPSRTTVYPAPNGGGQGVYNMLTAAVDGNGNIYVATHWDSGTGGDSIFVFRSSDEGLTWQGPYTMVQGSSSHSYGYVNVDANSDNVLVAVYSEWGAEASYFAKSYDLGQTWQTQDIGCCI